MTNAKRSKTEDLSFDRMLDDLDEQLADIERLKRSHDLVPPGWRRVAREAPITPPKTKLTLKLDAEMVDWFRGLGHGWQPRMNAVLRAYMHGVISKAVKGAETGGDGGQ
jgi:uncharacterized protein (DUF4415 family)